MAQRYGEYSKLTLHLAKTDATNKLEKTYQTNVAYNICIK